MPEHSNFEIATLFSPLLVLTLTILFALVLRPVALEIGLTDAPGGRKKHSGRVPLVGGLAMVIATGLGAAVTTMPAFWGILSTAMFLLVTVGVIDDRFELSPGVRLLTQAVAASLIVFAAGIVVSDLGTLLLFPLTLGPLGALFTVLFVMAVVNGFNLIDGIDGLAGGVAFMSFVALAILGLGTDVFGVSVLLAAAVAGFLLFNLPLKANRAVKVFMGDAGSTALGFAIASLGIVLTQDARTAGSPVIGLWIVAVPLYEVIAAFWRRFRDGRSPWSADDEHLHHGLLARGISARRALAFMLMLAAAFAAAGLVGARAGVPDAVMFLAWLAGGVLYYRMTRFPRSVASWVRSWKVSEHAIESFDATLVEPSPSSAGRGDGSD